MHKAIIKIGQRFRNPDYIEKYKFLKKSEKWSIEQLLEYQLVALEDITVYAYNNSEYYRELFDKHSFNPSAITSLDDLKKIPFTTKQDLLHNRSRININTEEKLFYAETSGSTGEPLIFYKNVSWDSQVRAALDRGRSWHGINPWDYCGYAWGINRSFKANCRVKLTDFLLHRFRIFSYKESDMEKFCKKLKSATYFTGYSSMIYEIAKKINTAGYTGYDLKLIEGTSEKIFPAYQYEVEKAFGQSIRSEYGAAETGLIAFECTCGNMHIVMENVIVEEINGEAVITNLLSRSFPIIRYKLGDYISLQKNTEYKCPCGMEHLIIDDIVGRVGVIIYGKQDTYPSLVLYYIFKEIANDFGIILNYQAIQNKIGVVNINFEEKINDTKKIVLKSKCRKYFKNDIDIIINEECVVRVQGKKKKDFISDIKENVDNE